MSDGEPTLPYPRDLLACTRAALAAARRLAAAGVRVDALSTPGGPPAGLRVASSLAASTGGRFRVLRDPTRFVAGYEHLAAAALEGVEIRNLTSGATALAESLERDGRFFAVLPLVEGENCLAIRARASGGAVGEHTLCVTRVGDDSAEPLDPRWLEPRRRLLETRLEALRRSGSALGAEWLGAVRTSAPRGARIRTLAVQPQLDAPHATDAPPGGTDADGSGSPFVPE
jgi:hypothetical protein